LQRADKIVGGGSSGQIAGHPDPQRFKQAGGIINIRNNDDSDAGEGAKRLTSDGQPAQAPERNVEQRQVEASMPHIVERNTPIVSLGYQHSLGEAFQQRTEQCAPFGCCRGKRAHATWRRHS
jgi:hypothetical protein